MKRKNSSPNRSSRRAFVQSMLAAGAAPWIVPAHVLCGAARPAPSGKITLGVIGVGSQGTGDMRDFLTNEHVRVTAVCDVNRRRIDSARQHIAKAYGAPDVRVYADFRELNADRSIDAVLMALPVALFVALYFLNRDYVMLLFDDPIGQKMLAGGVVLQVLGALVIRKIVTIKV